MGVTSDWIFIVTFLRTLHGIFFHTCVEVLLGDVGFPLILDNSFNLFPESLFNFMTKAGTMRSDFSNISNIEPKDSLAKKVGPIDVS